MSASPKKLYMEIENPFKLSLCAGQIALETKSLGSICWKTSILFLIFTVLNLL